MNGRCCTDTISSGRQYDGNGNVAEWWTPETIENFGVEAQCYIEQYNAFCYDDIAECVSYCFKICHNYEDIVKANLFFR